MLRAGGALERGAAEGRCGAMEERSGRGAAGASRSAAPPGGTGGNYQAWCSRERRLAARAGIGARTRSRAPPGGRAAEGLERSRAGGRAGAAPRRHADRRAAGKPRREASFPERGCAASLRRRMRHRREPGQRPEAADDPAVLRWTLTDGPAPAAPAGEPGVLWGREAESTAGFAVSAHGFAVNGVAFRRARAQPSCVSAGLKDGSCCCERLCRVCGAPGCRCAVWQCRHKDLQAAGLARSAVSRSGGCGKEPCDGSAASHMARGFGGTDRESDPRGARLPSQLVGMELNGKAQAIEWQRGVHGLVVLLNVCHQNVRPQLRIYPGGLCVVANVPRAVGGEVGNIKVPGGHSLELSLRR